MPILWALREFNLLVSHKWDESVAIIGLPFGFNPFALMNQFKRVGTAGSGEVPCFFNNVIALASAKSKEEGGKSGGSRMPPPARSSAFLIAAHTNNRLKLTF
jgi:hypothetical protein